MKLTRLLFGALGAFTLATSGGCIFIIDNNDTGDVVFDYVILEPDGAGGFVAPDCDFSAFGVDAIRLLVGDDLNFNGILDDNEVQEQFATACNQFDINGDGVIDAGELGLYGPVAFSADFFDLFAIEVLDFNGNPILWEPFDSTDEATRFSFGGGLNIIEDVVNDIQFAGVGQVGDAELQIFLGI